MPDQVTNKSAIAEQSQVRVVEVALPPSTSPSDKPVSYTHLDVYKRQV